MKDVDGMDRPCQDDGIEPTREWSGQGLPAIGLHFRWIKQALKIRKFFGMSDNVWR